MGGGAIAKPTNCCRANGNFGDAVKMDMSLFAAKFQAKARNHAGAFVGICFISILAYSYLATTILFTNHTLPNVWMYGYPSFKTTYEGRWAADIFIQLAGGSGVQSLQFILAIALKGLNAILLCKLMRIEKTLYVLAIGLSLALHPAFLDYYSFTVDDTSFEFGDTLALGGVLALARLQGRACRIICAMSLFVLSTALYQPKLALAASLTLLWIAADHEPDNSAGKGGSPISKSIDGLVTLVGTVAVYYLSIKLTTTTSGGERSHINSVYEIIQQIQASYREIFFDFTSRIDYLPRKFSFLPGLCLVLGIARVLIASWKAGYVRFIVSVAAIMAVPLALQLSYIIDDESWLDVGRILSPHAYLLSFMLGQLVVWPPARKIGIAGAGVLIYFFFIVASQESNAAAMKTIFDVEKINRIVSRIETAVPDLYSRTFSLVTIGELGMNNGQRLKRYPNKLYGFQFDTETFISYRQIDIVNFWLGRNSVKSPTQAEIDAAIESAKTRQSWPSHEAVFLQGNVIVVILTPYEFGSMTTLPAGK